MASIHDLMCRSDDYLEGYKRALLDSANSPRKWEELLENVSVAINYKKYNKYER